MPEAKLKKHLIPLHFLTGASMDDTLFKVQGICIKNDE